LGESGLGAVAAARLAAALEHIATRFRDPALSVAAVAISQGISARYLQGLLEMSGRSFTERVTELRLQRALALLTEADECPRRISDIALEAGFSDISHFNRLFRARFGDTPSAVRAQGRPANSV
jgi:AraC-like DNA-binding protein